MRLKLNELKLVQVFTSLEVDDGYIGTTTKYQPDRIVKANVQTAQSKLNAEIYGERVSEMLTLYLCNPNTLEKGEGISLNGEEEPTHKIIDHKGYRFHSVAIAEVMR